MSVIRRMDSALAGRISAGEVVERPASVVKELIENALDAGATEITVAIEDGGTRLIRTSDNGSGILAADMPLAVERFATSKTYVAEDLERITTLGFRGEALAAAYAVSRMEILSLHRTEKVASCLTGEGGAAPRVTPAARQPGTSVAIRDLFYNTPARKAFLKSPAAEASRVLRVVERAALAHAGVAFRLVEDGTEKLFLPPAGSEIERIADLYGKPFADTLVAVEATRGELRVSGYVSDPARAPRQSRRGILVLNGRPVDDYVLRGVAQRSLGPLLPLGRRPEVLLWVRMNPAAVDPNVSPDKSAFRLREDLDGALWPLVAHAIQSALASPAMTARLESTVRDAGVDVPQLDATGDPPLGTPPASPGADAWIHLFEPTEPAARPRQNLPAEPHFLVQVARTYLLAAGEEGIIIVDQHSAHERILYERLSSGEGGAVEVADLALPLRLDLSRSEAEALAEMEEELRRAHFLVEAAGPRSVWVRAHPAFLVDRDVGRLLRSILSKGPLPEGSAASAPRERLLQTIACHGAVRSGTHLKEAEMRALWKDLIAVDLACHDVHGRPGVVVIPHAEIMRRFGRSALSASALL